MLLSESVRNLAGESIKIDDSATYVSTAESWATIKDYGDIVLSEACMIAFHYKMRNSSDNSQYRSWTRMRVGGTLFVHGANETYASAWRVCAGVIWLAAGTYNILVQALRTGGGTTQTEIKDMKLGIVKLKDTAGTANHAYSSTINLTAAASRQTPLGATKNCVYYINAFAYRTGAACYFENVGDNLTNGVSITVDGVQRNWSERNQDDLGKEAASAKLAISLSAGASHSIAISKRHTSVVVHISVAASPWILPETQAEVVTQSFPQGSTLYMVTEPLERDPTKNVKVGKKRAVSHGDSTDYYYTNSGTGILESSYTFESVEAEGCLIEVSGYGGCISIIGVDVR